jgi:hypothetical protein
MSIAAVANAGLVSSEAHLLAELGRVEHFVRAAVAARESEAVPDPARMRQLHARGAATVSDEVVDTLLADTLLLREDPPELQQVREHVEALREENAVAARVSEAQGVFLRLAALVRYGGLTPLDTDLLLLSLLPAVDRRFIDILGYLEPHYRGAWLTLDLAERLLDAGGESRWCVRRRLAPDAPLRRHDLLRAWAGRSGDRYPAPRLQLQPDPRVVAFLQGDDAPDERIAPFVRKSNTARDPDELFFPADRFAALLDFVRRQPARGPGPIVHLTGPAGVGKKTLAATLAAQLARPLLVVERGLLQQATPALPSIVLREAMMQQAAVYWEGCDDWLSAGNPALQQAMKCALSAQPRWLFSAGRDDWQHHCRLGRRAIVEIALPVPRAEHLARCWHDATDALKPIDPDFDLESFTATVRLAPGAIEAAGATAAALSRLLEPGEACVSPRMLLASGRQLHSGGLSALARRVRARPAWDELVLPEVRKDALRDLGHHVRYRHKVMAQWGFGDKLMLGRGVSALFSGPPGTGKTMAAAVLAAELGLDLYHVDLSQVVSKYIGETEKHLARLFDEAEANSAILFFDEADALFGKRTDVGDAHDRYANLETSYLLQRIDDYEGLVILATNLSRNMDEAFMRRLRFIIPFTLPDRAERLAIWQRLLPRQTPRANDIDLGRLADEVDLSGGYLRNIVLSAAYLAVAEDAVLGMSHLVAATRREYAKIGRVFEADEVDSIFSDQGKTILEARHAAPRTV